jgi:predicted nucleotidyltransferase
LNDLYAARVVAKEKVGNSYIFSFNDRHLLAERIIALFAAERELVDLVVEKFAKVLKGKLDSIIVFGSVARGDAGASSDVDMVISFRSGVDPDKYRMKVVDASSETIAATGSSVDYFLIRQTELLEKMREKNKKGMWRDIFGDQPAILFRPRGDRLERSYYPKGEWMKDRI